MSIAEKIKNTITLEEALVRLGFDAEMMQRVMGVIEGIAIKNEAEQEKAALQSEWIPSAG